MNDADRDELGENFWAERPACAREDCTRNALSFANYCWDHLPDQAGYLEELGRRARTLTGLAGLNVAGVRLRGVAGPRADFAGAYLRGADLAAGDYRGADFDGADLQGASLRGANLAGASFRGTDGSFANLRGADLTRAELARASFVQADLSETRLAHARCEDADLAGTSLRGAAAAGALFRRVSFYGADLTGATLAGARFENGDVGEADLREADLYGALFRETDLGRARLPADMRVVNERRRRFAEAGEVYAELKLNFRQFGRFGLAEQALYREMVARRRARLAGAKKGRLWARARDVLELLFLDLYAGYGTKPWRPALGLGAAWLGFAVYYWLLPWFSRAHAGLVSYIDPGGGVPALADLSRASFERCLYFSFVTLTKLGFTSYEPYGWAKVAAGLEGSFAIVSYTVILVTVARKIWR